MLIGTYFFQLAAFFVGNGIFFFLDVTGRPKFLQKYKIQERKYSQDQEQQLVSMQHTYTIEYVNFTQDSLGEV